MLKTEIYICSQVGTVHQLSVFLYLFVHFNSALKTEVVDQERGTSSSKIIVQSDWHIERSLDRARNITKCILCKSK